MHPLAMVVPLALTFAATTGWAQSAPPAPRTFVPAALAPRPSLASRLQDQAPTVAMPDSVRSGHAVRGAVIGGAALGTFTAIGFYAFCTGDSSNGSCGGRTLGAFAMGAVVGAVVGGMLGSL